MIPSNNWELMTATFKFTFDSMSEELQSALLEIPGVKWRKKGFWEVPYNAAGVVDELRKSFGAKFTKIDFGKIKPIPDVKEEDWGKITEIMVSNGMRPEYLDGSLGFPLEFQRDGILMGWNRTGISYWYSTGSGKTYVSIAQALKHPGLVIFVTRSGARIQMMREIERFTRTRAYVLRAPSSLKKTTLVQGQTWKDFMKERMPELGKIGLVAAEWKQRIAEHGKEQKLKVQSVDEYLELRKSREETPFIVVGWEALPIHLEKLVSLKPVTVIFDEAHLGKGSKRNERVILAPLPEDAFEAEQQREADAKEAKEKGGFVVEEDKNGEQSRSMIIPVMNRAAAAALLSRQVKRRIGLSVAGDSHVILRGGCFGTGWCGTIKTAYELASKHYAITEDGGYNLLQLSGQGIETRGWEENVGFKWVRIKTLIAHQINELGVSCKVRGLELRTTADHSIYVQREIAKFKLISNRRKYYGYVDTIPASDICESDLLLGDKGSLWEEGSHKEPIINVLSYAAINLDAQVAVHLKEGHRSILLEGGMSKPKTSKALCRKGPHGTHLPLSTFMELKDKLGDLDVKIYVTQGLGSQNWVKSTLLWSDLAYLLGVYLGNGWLRKTTKGEVGSMGLVMPNHKLDKVRNYVLNKEGIKFGYSVSSVKAKCTEIRVSNCIVMSMLNSVMGKVDAKTKYIPNEWLFTWPIEARRQLLEGLIDTDGHRGKKDRIYYITASSKLKDTLCVLLTSLGIPWSVSHRPPGDGGTIDGRQITGTESWCINWALSAMPWDKGYPDTRVRGSKYIWDEHGFNDVNPRDIKPVMLNAVVYDIEREEGHPSFTANNVLVHNTATALSGFIRDLWAQLDFIEPNAWGNKFQFQTRYCDLKQGQYGMIDNGSSNLDELLKRALRSAHRVPMHIAQAGLLNKKRRQSIYVAPEDQNVERAGFNAELKAAAKRGPTALLECRLAQSATKKRTVGVELITENLNSKQKVCIFTARKKDCVIMFEDLAKKNKGVDGWWATGDLDEQEKQRIVDAYMSHPGPCYLVATGQAFGASINLHDTDAAYLIQLPYDTISLKQWEGRWVRFGMKRSVVISYLIAEGTVDEHVASLLINKLPMSELIMGDQELAEAEKFIAGMDKYKDADEFAMGVLSMIDGDYDGSDDD